MHDLLCSSPSILKTVKSFDSGIATMKHIKNHWSAGGDNRDEETGCKTVKNPDSIFIEILSHDRTSQLRNSEEVGEEETEPTQRKISKAPKTTQPLPIPWKGLEDPKIRYAIKG